MRSYQVATNQISDYQIEIKFTFSINFLTSDSFLCLEFEYGFASKESKLGSPDPGTTELSNPLACPIK